MESAQYFNLLSPPQMPIHEVSSEGKVGAFHHSPHAHFYSGNFLYVICKYLIKEALLFLMKFIQDSCKQKR